MALHGEIKINNLEIIYWEAVRQESLHDEDAEYTYKAKVTTEKGTWESYVTHTYSDGAAALASRVLYLYHLDNLRKR